MRKILVFIMTIVLCLAMTACGKYNSHYTSIVLITRSSSDEAYMHFGSFNGTNVFKVKSTDKKNELRYSAELGEGSMTVYYDDDGTKKELFTINGGEKIEETTIELETGTTYLIFESDGNCKDGTFEFEIV